MVFGAPDAVLMDLPQLTEDQPAHRPLVAAHAVPWPGEMAVFRSPSTDGFELLTTFGSRARMGELVSDLYAGPTSRFDLGNALVVDLLTGTLENVTDLTPEQQAEIAAIENRRAERRERKGGGGRGRAAHRMGADAGARAWAKPAGELMAGGRRCRERDVGRLDGDLLEIPIVEPEVAAVGHQQLTAFSPRGPHFPAEASRPINDEAADAFLHRGAPRIDHALRELGAQGLEPLEEAIERGGRRGRRRELCHAKREHDTHAKLERDPHQPSGGAGASTSRAPFDCSGPTMPADSIASRSRAARL